MALRAAGHSNAPLPHRGETAAGGPAGRHSRNAASLKRALQDPGRRLRPQNSQGLRGGERPRGEERQGGKEKIRS